MSVHWVRTTPSWSGFSLLRISYKSRLPAHFCIFPPIQTLAAHSAQVYVHRALDPNAHSSALFFSTADFTPAVLCLAWATFLFPPSFFFSFPFHVIRGDLTVWPSLASNSSSSGLCRSSAEITDVHYSKQPRSPSCLSNFSLLFPGHGFVYTVTLNLSLF